VPAPSGLGVTAGPGLNAPDTHKMSFVPAHRRAQLESTANRFATFGFTADVTIHY
jgi:hypothetical protein